MSKWLNNEEVPSDDFHSAVASEAHNHVIIDEGAVQLVGGDFRRPAKSNLMRKMNRILSIVNCIPPRMEEFLGRASGSSESCGCRRRY